MLNIIRIFYILGSCLGKQAIRAATVSAAKPE